MNRQNRNQRSSLAKTTASISSHGNEAASCPTTATGTCISRKTAAIGTKVSIVLKADQRTGKRTVGVVARLLTKSPTHPHGIKVILEDGQVGRVQEIL